jgi:hypothetical protein
MSFGQSVTLSLITSTVTCALGITAAFVGLWLKLREQKAGLENKIGELRAQMELNEEASQEQAVVQWRLRYFDPLYAATRELKDRIALLRHKIGNPDECKQMREWFKFVKDTGTHKGTDEQRRNDFYFWCNGIGHFAMTSLYDVAAFLAYARRIRSEAPYILVSSTEFQRLTAAIQEVSNGLGGEYNIWKESQQTIGAVVWRGDSAASYRDFCVSFTTEAEAPWYLRMMDFFADVHLKDGDLAIIRDSLQRLEDTMTKLTFVPSTAK